MFSSTPFGHTVHLKVVIHVTDEQRSLKEKSIKRLFILLSLEDDLDILLNQLHQLEQQFDDDEDEKTFCQGKTSMSSAMIEQFEQLDQTLATLTHTLNNVEIEFLDSGNSSSSSATSDSTRIHDEHFSDSGLSRSTDSLSLPMMSQQISNASSVREKKIDCIDI